MRRKLLGLIVALMAMSGIGLYIAYDAMDRTPGELLRYAERRLLGHPKLESVFVPAIHWARRHIERPVADLDPAIQWRGATADFSPRPPADASLAALEGQAKLPGSGVIKLVSSTQALIDAIASARPGDDIVIAAGRYRLSGQSLLTKAAGLKSAPIVVRARKLGEVLLEFNLLEGFHVLHSNWVFENLEITGACSSDDNCEHAFHVAGNAHSTVIRNNRIRDFNAHIKVNGMGGAYPDFGVIEANTLFNSRARKTANPVTPVDIVGANGWQVLDNFIADFVKLGGNQVSYGVFIKGGGSGGRVERNMIVCALNLQNQAGLRVGLSFGGGGTGADYCRGGACAFEHDQGFAANNVIAHCNDFGLDVNRSKNITLVHNTLINTAGIDIRNFPASAAVSNNLIEGRIRERAGGWFIGANNWQGSAHELFAEPDTLDFRDPKWPSEVPVLAAVPQDICGEPRRGVTRPGAIAGRAICLLRPQ